MREPEEHHDDLAAKVGQTADLAGVIDKFKVASELGSGDIGCAESGGAAVAAGGADERRHHKHGTKHPYTRGAHVHKSQ
jgi:hypothetical protein